ncbi:nucleotidyltransferase family protein [Sediminibacterium ginsengisoli]|uniref:Nucleotidyl transferase n=1 Tax=Sediminibacterium ginsengisoli TaxID=413434 RepID=A0A1T4JUG8_9BACT|nr:sugar phosphate nucleotidyltransferase [Sediminibacterium ginsengisoli]SJZ33816.1 Nucleotidyl transferase [Sediminibacterium ginsengisoli]
MKAMIFAAGLGSRLKPWTDHHPKALAVVNGKSLLQRNILYLQQYGITEVIVNVHHFAGQVIAAVENAQGWGSRITFSDETAEVLETGGGLQKAAWYFEGESSFVVMNADILTDMDLGAMISTHNTGNAMATLAVSDRSSSRYFLFNEAQELKGWQNVKTGEQRPEGILEQQPALKPKAFSGIHVISTAIFPQIKQQGKFSMVDVYLSLMNAYPIRSFDHTGALLIDVGKPESLEKAEQLFQ